MSVSTPDKLHIPIDKLGDKPEFYSGELDSAILELKEEDGIIPFTPITYELSAQLLDTELLIQGRLCVELDVTCARCAEFISTKVDDSAFVRSFDLSEMVDEFDILPELREALMLKLPTFPLCSEDCLGFCPQCGVKRSEQSCDCTPAPEKSSWDALDGLSL